jgi:UDP-N-acetylglucosamine acyltransferase
MGDSVFLAGNCGVHQYCRVGRLSMVGAGSILVQDLVPFCISYNSRTVGSLNLVGLRRAGLRQHIAPLARAFGVMFLQRHTMKRAIEMLEQSEAGDALVQEMAAFARGSHRGVTGFDTHARGAKIAATPTEAAEIKGGNGSAEPALLRDEIINGE